MREAIEELRSRALREIAAAANEAALDELRISFVGKKGEFTLLMKGLGSLEPEKRKETGALINSVKAQLEEALDARRNELGKQALSGQLEREKIDVTLPVDAPLITKGPGSLHPITHVQRDLERIFRGMGFTVVDGPEVEREYYNFDALNIPSNHPARDMQDTVWLKAGDVLRTHTSSMQVRSLEKMKPPIRIVVPGRCFRYERIDASHEHTFYQIEGMMIDRNISVAHLSYFFRVFLRELFGHEPKFRLRPGYFPFVEPGIELDMWWKGRWLELIGSGLVHPKVIEYGGLDPNEWQGFAFGLGLSRLAMLRYQITDIRHMQAGDLRFLRQFS